MSVLPSQLSKIWSKYKTNGKVVKGKHTGRPRKTTECQDIKPKAICLEDRRSTIKDMKNKLVKTAVNGYDGTIRTRLKEMGFIYREAKHNPSLTTQQKKTRLQGAEQKQRRSCIGDDWMKVVFRDES